MDKFDLKWSNFDYLFRLDPDEPRLLLQVVFFEPAVDQSQGESGAVNGNVDFGEEVGDGANVVFVAVGQDHGANLLLVLLQVGKVGHDQVHAQQLRVGE